MRGYTKYDPDVDEIEAFKNRRAWEETTNVYYPWHQRLRQLGFKGRTASEILKEALQINSGAACEAAIVATLNASARQLDFIVDLEYKRGVLREILRSPQVQAVATRLRQIRGEAI